jgi:hypothetical protein
MKNKLYYVLFLLYAAVAVFVLYLNGVFDGGEINLVNVLINVGFLIIIGILFLISTISFGRLNRCTDELETMTVRLPEEYKAAGGKSVWSNYQDRRDVFADGELNPEFSDDRLHLTAAGYDAWLSELRPALDRVNDLPPMSRPIRLPDLSAQ